MFLLFSNLVGSVSCEGHCSFCWTIKKAECWRTDAFELWCWRRFLTVPWTARRSSQSILKEILEYSLEGLMLKLQYFGRLMRSRLTGKDPGAEKDWGQEEKGVMEDEMVGWYHRLNGHEFEQTPGDGERQGSLACCSPWGRKELDTTWQVNNNNKTWSEQGQRESCFTWKKDTSVCRSHTQPEPHFFSSLSPWSCAVSRVILPRSALLHQVLTL